MALSLKDSCPEKGFVARIGGDEFVVVCPNKTHEQASTLVNKLYNHINNLKVDQVFISVSIGLAVRNSMEQTTKEMVIESENSMNRKKITEGQSMRN